MRERVGRSCGVNLDGLCSRLRMSSKLRVESLGTHRSEGATYQKQRDTRRGGVKSQTHESLPNGCKRMAGARRACTPVRIALRLERKPRLELDNTARQRAGRTPKEIGLDFGIVGTK